MPLVRVVARRGSKTACRQAAAGHAPGCRGAHRCSRQRGIPRRSCLPQAAAPPSSSPEPAPHTLPPFVCSGSGITWERLAPVSQGILDCRNPVQTSTHSSFKALQPRLRFNEDIPFSSFTASIRSQLEHRSLPSPKWLRTDPISYHLQPRQAMHSSVICSSTETFSKTRRGATATVAPVSASAKPMQPTDTLPDSQQSAASRRICRDHPAQGQRFTTKECWYSSHEASWQDVRGTGARLAGGSVQLLSTGCLRI